MKSSPGSAEELLQQQIGPIAIVGNATPSRPLGRLIDSHTSIIRLDNYRIDGFPPDVGRRTTLRCTSAWTDIEHRDGPPEFSPFTAAARESVNLAEFNRANPRPVLSARTDVHALIPEVTNPSTGFALVQLCASLGIPVDLFGFDGFKTAHHGYGDGSPPAATHAPGEIEWILRRPGVVLYGETYPYEDLYDFCHSTHPEYRSNVGLKLFQRLGRPIRGERILEFGAGNGQLAAHLESLGNRVLAVEISRKALARIPAPEKLQGDALTLACLTGPFDRFVSFDVLEHLTANDVRIVIREAARLARRLMVSVSTRPSGLLGPSGENLHLTVEPPEWWREQWSPHFDVEIRPGDGIGQFVIEGVRRDAAIPHEITKAAESPRPAGPAPASTVSAKPAAPVEFHLPHGYCSRLRPEYYEDSVSESKGIVWQPDVYSIAAILARDLGCGHVLDLGCGHAGKLTALAPEFEITGVDFGSNLAYCREHLPSGRWIEADLEVCDTLDLPQTLLERSVVICSDVIEHLVDPSALLHLLRNLLRHARVAVLTTPERDLARGRGHMGPPDNPAHVREWNLDELEALLRDSGLDVVFMGLTRSSTASDAPRTQIAIIRGSSTSGFPTIPAGRGDPLCHKDGRLIRMPDAAPAEVRDESEAAIQPRLPADELRTLLTTCRAAIESGDITAARDALQRACAGHPGDADLSVTLGDLAAAAGDLATARMAYARALTMHPGHPAAREALILLATESDAADEAHAPTAAALSDARGVPIFSASPPAADRPASDPFAHLRKAFDLLRERRFLEAQTACHAYRQHICHDLLPRTDNRPAGQDPAIAVVIVAYRIGNGLIECLDSLQDPSAPPHEIIVVDNGGNESIAEELARRPILHIRMPMNVILSEGRNVGVHFARAPIVAFIDDDAIVARGHLASVVEAFHTFDIAALRGKVLPKSEHPNNSRARHYDLGDTPFPADIDTEGNSAFRTEVFRALGGMDPLLFGGEGVELSYRIASRFGGHPTIYWPFAVIFHDYAATDAKLETKNARHQLMRDYSAFKHPGIREFHDRLVAFARTGESRMEASRLIARRPAPTAPAMPSASPRASVDDPFISICIPTYNRAAFIAQTLQSALAQTYTNFEIVVVDDGSTDNTATVLASFTDPRIRYFRKEHSGGPATRNRCIAEARGEFIVWLDSDDVILPHTLRRYADALGLDPTVDVLYGDLQVANQNLEVDGLWSYNDYFGWNDALLSDSAVANRIPNVCTLVRKSCYDRHGGYDPEFPRAHDFEFWTRLAGVADFRHVNGVVGIYRRHEQSLSKLTSSPDTRYEARVVRRMIDRHGLTALFPFAFPVTGDDPPAEARAATLAALILLKYGDHAGALDFAKRAATADPGAVLPAIVRRCLDPEAVDSGTPKAGELPGRDRRSPALDELLERAIRAYRNGRTDACTRACARMAELASDEPETLLLVGLALSRWGDPQTGLTAFRCLVQRACADAFLAACTAAETGPRTGDDAFTADSPAHPSEALAAVINRLAPGADVLPQHVAFALEALAVAAAAAAPAEFLRRNRSRQSSLLFALLALSPRELEDSAGPAVAAQAARVRTALQPASSPVEGRTPGYSFCIITNGRRPEKLRRQVESIRALGLPEYEILVGGEFDERIPGVRYIDLTAAARAGRLGKMRNALTAVARHDHVVVSDDDLVFTPGFAEGLRRFGEGYDAMSVRLLNPDGTRFWDWASTGGTRGAVLLDYHDTDPCLYVTGGCVILKATVLERVAWNDALGFYQGEDVDFSRRLRAAGLELRHNLFATVIHDDDRYTRVQRRVMRIEDIIATLDQRLPQGCDAETQRLIAAALHLSERHPDRRETLARLAARHRVTLPEPHAPSRTGRAIHPANPAAQPPRIRVAWEGSFLDFGSLSHVNRSLCEAMSGHPGIEVTAVGPRPADSRHLACPDLGRFAARLQSGAAERAITVRHSWPPDWSRPTTGRLVVIQPWEYGALPATWVAASPNVDEFWVPSRYVRSCYIESGIPAGKVHVIPNGIDPTRFHPGIEPLPLPTKKRFKFLFVGGTIHRKGPDVLLKAWLNAFTATDDVCLVIKDFGGGSVYAGQTMAERIRAAQALPNAPEIVYIDEEWPADKLPALYAACDCLVHPYRGEGFGLPILEAMACGLPVIMTSGGAADDFAGGFAWTIPASRHVIGTRLGDIELRGQGWLLEPDTAALVPLLREAAGNPAAARERGAAGSRHVHEHFSWQRIAETVADRLNRLAEASPADASPVRRSADSASATTSRPRGGPAPISLPACARLGQLNAARELVRARKPKEAWSAALEAIAVRPHHPEAFLLLAEIARSAGDIALARACANRARELAPGCRATRKFLRNLPGKGQPHLRGLELPSRIRASMEGARPRLSVCLIARDEEHFLPRCLASIQPIADQIVVLDTGSTDRTVEIAREFGAEVHSFTWNDDFSAARNAAMEHVTGDWVLALDADEEIPAAHHERLLADMQHPTALGIRLPLVNTGREQEGASYVPRLFRNAPGLFYVSRVHEQIFSSILVRARQWGMDTALGTAAIVHHGYATEVVRDRNKTQRNLRLLEMAIREIPGDASLLMNLGLELIHAGELQAGLARYQEALDALGAQPVSQQVPELRETLLSQYTAHLTRAGRPDAILRVMDSSLARVTEPTASLHFTHGLALLKSGRPREAAEAFRRCIATRHKPALSPVNPAIHGVAPHHCLANCLSQLGDSDGARAALLAALEIDPGATAVKMDLARLLHARQEPVEALQLLHQVISSNPESADAWSLGGEIALSRADYLPFALDWTGEAVRHHTSHPGIAAQRATALLLAGDTAAALPLWRSVASSSPQARAAIAFCEVGAGERTTPVDDAEEPATSAEFLKWYGRLVDAGAAQLLRRINSRIPELARVLPTAAQRLDAAIAEAA